MSHALWILRFLRPCVERLSPSLHSSSLDDIKSWIWTFAAEGQYLYLLYRRSEAPAVSMLLKHIYHWHMKLPNQFNNFYEDLTANCRQKSISPPYLNAAVPRICPQMDTQRVVVFDENYIISNKFWSFQKEQLSVIVHSPRTEGLIDCWYWSYVLTKTGLENRDNRACANPQNCILGFFYSSFVLSF